MLANSYKCNARVSEVIIWIFVLLLLLVEWGGSGPVVRQNTEWNEWHYYLLQLSFHSVAVVLKLVTNKDKYTRNNKKTQQIQVQILPIHPQSCQNNHTLQNPHTHTLKNPHIHTLQNQHIHTHTHITKPTHTHITKPSHPHIKKPTHTHITKPTHTHTPTHYKTHTYKHYKTHTPTHYKTQTLQNPHIQTLKTHSYTTYTH